MSVDPAGTRSALPARVTAGARTPMNSASSARPPAAFGMMLVEPSSEAEAMAMRQSPAETSTSVGSGDNGDGQTAGAPPGRAGTAMGPGLDGVVRGIDGPRHDSASAWDQDETKSRVAASGEERPSADHNDGRQNAEVVAELLPLFILEGHISGLQARLPARPELAPPSPEQDASAASPAIVGIPQQLTRPSQIARESSFRIDHIRVEQHRFSEPAVLRTTALSGSADADRERAGDAAPGDAYRAEASALSAVGAPRPGGRADDSGAMQFDAREGEGRRALLRAEGYAGSSPGPSIVSGTREAHDPVGGDRGEPQLTVDILDQIGPAIGQALASAGVGPSDATSEAMVSVVRGALPSPEPVPPRFLKLLEIALQPEDLGRIEVRLSMSDDALGVDMKAENGATARFLSEHATAIADRLTESGYAVEGVRVTEGGDGASFAASSSSLSSSGSDARHGQQGAQGDARASPDRGGRRQDAEHSDADRGAPGWTSTRRGNFV